MGYGSDDDSLYGSSEDGDHCGEAVMAAMQAISDHCDTSGTPVELPTGQVMMVPEDSMGDLRAAEAGSMSEEEIIEIVEASPWMSGIIERNCNMAGLEPGTSEYDQCVVRFARNLMDSV